MRLLLDVHHNPAVARRLRAEGHNVVGAAEDASVAALGDEDLLRLATRQGRSVVTENLGDFSRISRDWGLSGEHHAGIVMTSWRRYRRGTVAYPGNLIAALRTLLGTSPDSTPDRIFWIP